MPLNNSLLNDMALDRQEDIETRRNLENQLAEIEDKLRLYDSEAWSFFKSKLEEEEEKAIKQMLEADADDLPLKREKVRTLRHLGQEETSLRRSRARLVADLAALDRGE